MRAKGVKLIFGILLLLPGARVLAGQELTPLQHQIEVERARLASGEAETRRDAVMRLAALHRPDAVRAAASALNDSSPMVRAAAAHALDVLDKSEAAALLIPLLQNDKDEFVRREAAYALGEMKNRDATNALIAALLEDKSPAVRAASAVALGEIGASAATPALALAVAARVSDAQLDAASTAQIGNLATRRKTEKDEFVRRAAAVSLGQIGDARAVPALIAVLNDKRASADLRREAARALGEIGDARAASALQSALDSRDPYLFEAAREAIKKINSKSQNNPSTI